MIRIEIQTAASLFAGKIRITRDSGFCRADKAHDAYEANSLGVDDRRPCNIGLLCMDSLDRWQFGNSTHRWLRRERSHPRINLVLARYETADPAPTLKFGIKAWSRGIAAIIVVHCVGNGMPKTIVNRLAKDWAALKYGP